LRSFALISNLYQSLSIFTNSRLINRSPRYHKIPIFRSPLLDGDHVLSLKTLCQKTLMPIVLAGPNDGCNLAGRFQNGCSTAPPPPPQPQQQQAAQQQQSNKEAMARGGNGKRRRWQSESDWHSIDDFGIKFQFSNLYQS
jgi:hypothetical protein